MRGNYETYTAPYLFNLPLDSPFSFMFSVRKIKSY